MASTARAINFPGESDMSKKRRDPLQFNPRGVRTILENKDALTTLGEEGKKLRAENLIVAIAGTKFAGKTEFADWLYIAAQEKGIDVLVSRASQDAAPEETSLRKALIERQREADLSKAKQDLQWYQVIEALRREGYSAIERKVLPFLRAHQGKSKGLLVLARYPYVDTLAKQLLRGPSLPVSLTAIAQYLRGVGDLPSGYINPDITLIFTCRGLECIKRYMLTKEPRGLSSVESTQELGPSFADRTDMGIAEYRLVTGYNKQTGKIESQKTAFPGEAHWIDTSTNFNYESPDIREQLHSRRLETNKRILEKILLP